MSRTYKDKPSKFKYEPWDKDRYLLKTNVGDYFHHYNYLWTKTTKTKKRKEQDTEWHWMGTPSDWTRLMMNKPQRRAGTLWEREVVKCQVADLEEVDKPSVSRKPHIYYW